MKLFLKICVYVLLSISISNISLASDIYFINMEKVIYLSNPGKLIITNLEEINESNLSIFKEKVNELNIKENNILKSKKNLSEQEFNNKIKEFRKKITNYNNEKNKKITNFNKLKKQKVDNLVKKFIPIVEDYMKENNISFLIDKKNIFIANNKYDITDDIIKLINKEFKND